MNYIFYEDGTFKKLKTNKLKKDLNIAWYLIDIGTMRKGPLFTMVRDINLNYKKDNVSISYDTTYAPYDLPFDENTTLYNEFIIDSLEKYYNVYPLIKQVFGFNIYRTYSDNCSCIVINSIMINYNNTMVMLDEGLSDKEIKKSFQYLNMRTHVSDIMKYQFDEIDVILLRGNKYFRETIYAEDIYFHRLCDMKWDNVIIPLIEIESCYMMSYDEFFLFTNANHISVYIVYDMTDEDEYADDVIYSFNIYSLTDFLLACIYIPQMILMERNIYDNSFGVIVETSIFGRDLKLEIDDSEIDEPICLYDIISKLLRIQL